MSFQISVSLSRFLYSFFFSICVLWVRRPPWFIALIYYGVWFGGILCAVQGWVWSAFTLLILFGVWVLWKQEHWAWKLAVGSFLYGLIIDSLLVYGGCFSFPTQSHQWTPSPLWMGGFWFAFSALLTGPLRWLLSFPVIAIAGGIIGGPFSYWGRAQMGGRCFSEKLEYSLGGLGVSWAFSMWIYCLLFNLLSKTSTDESQV